MKSICEFSRLVLWAILPALCPSVQADTGRAVVRHAPVLNGNVEGSLQQLLGESVVANGGATITGDLFVPGTPTVALNGRPTYGGTVDGAGGESPSGYRITLNGTCSLRHVVRRTDPVPIPTVEAPPAPQGTRSVVINSGSPGPGDFSTLRNLTLNGNVGQVAIPPGSYGNFVANGNSGFTLGIAGATEPSRYALQQLTLNGATQLNVVGPIILTLVHGFSANGDLGASSNPSWLKLNVQSGNIVLNGGASLCGYVVAPDSTVILNGNSRLIGGLVSNRLTLNGNSLLRIVEALANQPPSVVFTAPADGAVVSDTSAIMLTAVASDPDGTIAKVEFFSGPTKLGEATVAPYQFSWTNVAPGSYTLTARATDDLGEVAISDSVSIQVMAPNVPPSVSLTTPVADTVFSAPAGITLSAAATDADGSVAKVEFFNGEAKLGEATVAPYDYVWRDVASGVYVLTVRATDDAGAVGLSDPVSIRVNAHPAAVALTLTTMINTALPVMLAGSDPEGDALAFSVMTPPAHGTLSGTAPALTYTPMANYAGADAFSYAVSDPYGSSESAIVSIQVEAPVEPPTAENAALEVQVGSSAPITLQGADARGRPLTFTIVTPPALGSVQQISNEGQTSHWTYSAGSAAGLDTFTFIVSNGAQSSSPATVKIRVLPAPPLASGTQGKAGGIVRDALTLEPLEGVTVRVEGVDGAVLSDDAGNFMLPVVNFGDETAVSEVLVYEASGYIPAYRRVIAYPDVPVTADPVFLKKYDSKITPIGPATSRRISRRAHPAGRWPCSSRIIPPAASCPALCRALRLSLMRSISHPMEPPSRLPLR